MKHISILVPKGAILGSLEGSRQLLTQVNDFFRQKDEPPVFNVQLVGLSKETPVSGGIFTVNTDVTLKDVTKTDLIIIPAIDGDLQQAIEKNRDFIPWIIEQYKGGAEVASLCLGAFLMAATGIVNGKRCATHWMAENAFKRMYPEVELVREKIITDEKGIYSSGGAFSYLNLILHLIGKFAGREMAILAAKVFAIEIGRESQSSFVIFRGQKDHEDEPVKKAQEFIENNVTERISVEDLAAKFAIGRRNFERRFKKATNNTPVEYIQRVKIEVAKMTLESSRKNVNEVMYDVGYSDTKAFRSVFKKITGLSPVDYRNKYNKELAFN
ncbi:GlxA family transcriptional regulator [Flavihumibacter solisilvae]|uniref:AraC family transcriptional regulator n=1 Tax=Flavihumibacter solisilvae TaxID=1349421 RepID=A0A0C1L6D8_9BACT|nr:helix-turn-helix domain-containing protein [Flavihumibacter solisilvae]KIC95702.1 AraC family transcriptional regulator [Flavihumibacter solisilvae]